jgi:hypothetical protein
MLPLTINGFGVREAVFAFFARLHLGLSPALALSLGSTGLIMLFSLSAGHCSCYASTAVKSPPRAADTWARPRID